MSTMALFRILSRIIEIKTDLIKLQNIFKSFGSLVALNGVDIQVNSGEVLALLGENGAGKTSLMKVLAGLIKPDSGVIIINDSEVIFKSPIDAEKFGIGMVHQHFMLTPTLNLIENIAIAKNNALQGTKARSDLRLDVLALMERTGLEVPLGAKIETLSVGEQQRAEILRALMSGSNYLILDEPTANLAPFEVAVLLPQIRLIAKRDNIGVVIITHHLDEVLDVADEIVVLRDGNYVGKASPSKTTTEDLARMMVGHNVKAHQYEMSSNYDETNLVELKEVSAISERKTLALNSVSLSVRRGEIYSIVGVEGNGQAELENLFLGLLKPTAGSIVFENEEISTWNPGKRIKNGIISIPSDRYRCGLVSDLSIAKNLVIDRTSEEPFARRGLLDLGQIENYGDEIVDLMSIKASSARVVASSLSGGHAQRVVLGRALRKGLKLLVACQPTRGLDVGAVKFIWEQIQEFKKFGAGVILITSDLSEALSISDKIGVLYRGKIQHEFERNEYDRILLGRLMGGDVSGAKK